MSRHLSRALLAGACGALLLCAPLEGQVRPPRRPPRDTVAAPDTAAARDTLAARQDTTALPDTVVLPLPRFSEIFAPEPAPVGFTTFSWNREELLLEGHVTVADLLERVPGMTGIRGGLYLQPEAVTAFGQTRGRVEIVLDGYVLDPLMGSTLDLAHIEVTQLIGLRVERRLDVTRVHLSTAEATETRAYSRVEAATGEPDGSVFRGIFIAPRVFVGPLALAVDRVDSDGPNGAQPADVLAFWGKWSWLARDSTRGLQVEYRQSRLRRPSGVPWAADADRRDVIVRARQRIATGVALELYGGHGNLAETEPDTTVAEGEVRVERGHWQVGARASMRWNAAWLDADLRMRDSWALPNRQVDVSAGLRPFRQLALAGNLTSVAWRGDDEALAWNVRAELRPIAALGAFAEITDGERGAPYYRDVAGVTTALWGVFDERRAQRFGGNLRAFGIDVAGAWVKLETDQVGPFGLPFDSTMGPQPAAPATGLEVFGRVTLWPRLFTAYGSFQNWQEAPGWMYLPTRSWRAGIELHTRPLRSDNLEILARVESQRRGPMLVPDSIHIADQPWGPIEMPGQDMVHAYLQIRVIDVRAYIAWQDILAVRRQDLPGRLINGRRIVYGVKWQLFD